jgi:hypothetical protein
MAIADDKEEEKQTSQFKVVYFLMTVSLQIISFFYLFNYRSTEYIVYIFSFIVFCVSPFVWLNDLIAVGSVLNPNSRYYNLFQYKELSLAISSLLLFLGIFCVLLTNENVRKQKVDQKLKADKVDHWKKTKPTEKLNSLKTTNLREDNNKTILRLYALVVVLSWGLVLEAFSDSETFGEKMKKGTTSSGFVELTAWFLNKPQIMMNGIDKTIHDQTDSLTGVTPMIKAFSVYVVTFITLFFGLFIRIPIGVSGVNYNKIHVANMENIYGQKFIRNLDQNRNIAIFFTSCVLSFLSWGMLYAFLNKFSDWSNLMLVRNISVGTVLKSSYFLFVMLIFGTLFAKRKSLSSQNVKVLVMFLLALLCSALGTPVLMGMIQFILELSGQSLVDFLPQTASGIFVLLFVIVMFFGKKWIHDDAYKRIQILNAVLVCMSASLFMGLSTTYNMFTNAFYLIRFIFEAVFVFIVPLLIVIMSFILFMFAFKSHQKGLIMTDG